MNGINVRAGACLLVGDISMKAFLSMVLCLIGILFMAGCSKADMSKTTIDYGTSSIYSEEDMNAAIEVIKEKFSTFDGCVLHSLSYMSDEICSKVDNLSWMNDLRKPEDDKEAFTQCIAFGSSFRSPKYSCGAWSSNRDYTWSWWLARSEGGEWKLITWGY